MHHLRLELRGADDDAATMRARLEALGAEADDDGRLLVLATTTEPTAVRKEVLADVPRGRIEVERFELHGTELVLERWNPKSTSRRGVAAQLRPEPFDDRWYDDGGRWGTGFHGGRYRSSYGDAREEVAPAVRAATAVVLARSRRRTVVDAEDVLAYVVGLGRLASSASVEDPALLDAAAFLLDHGALAAARTPLGTDAPFERALLATRAAWRVEQHDADAPLLGVLEELAASAAALLGWSRQGQLRTRAAVEPTCRTALAACLRVIAAPGPTGGGRVLAAHG